MRCIPAAHAPRARQVTCYAGRFGKAPPYYKWTTAPTLLIVSIMAGPDVARKATNWKKMYVSCGGRIADTCTAPLLR